MIESDVFEESKFLFRGQENERWKVETSAYRRLKRETTQKEMPEEDELYYNLGLIEQFKHADFHSGNSSKIMKMDLGILAQLQHNGAATSLIDFSDNPLVALYFACKENAGTKNNGKVFILSTGDENKFEEISSIKQIQNSTIRVPEQIEFFKGKNILNKEKSVYWKPAHLNNRITAQQSYFLIGEIMDSDMKKIIIKGDLKASILEELSLVYGINEITLFPDLVGFAQANSTGSPSGKEEMRLRKRMIIRHHDEIIEEINKEQEDTKANKVAKTAKLIKAYNNRATAKYNFNDYEGAAKDFTEIIKINPRRADTYYNRGVTKNKLNDHEGAIDDYNKSIKIFPKNAKTYYNCGITKSELKNYKGAIGDYNKAIKIDPKDANTYYNRGNAKRQLKNYKGAIDDYSKSIEIEPTDASAYNNRGATKNGLKDYKGAIDDYNKAIKIDPSDAIAYNNRGNAKSGLGLDKYELKDYQGAIDDYQGTIDDYQTASKLSKDKNLTGAITQAIKQSEEKLKELQEKLFKDKK